MRALAAAAIALKVTFDKVFSAKEDSNQLVRMSQKLLVKRLEQECQMRYYERVCPGLLKTIKDNYWHRAVWYTAEASCCQDSYQS